MGLITGNPSISLQANIGAPHIYYIADGAAIFGCVGDPEGVIAANKRSVALSDDGNIYFKTTDGVNTGWVASGGGGGGTVTSVALTVPGVIFDSPVVGSPITTSGTFALALATQLQNRVFASPNGASGTPTFRALVASDLPALAPPPTNGIPYNDGTNTFGASNGLKFDPATNTIQSGELGVLGGKLQLQSSVSGSITHKVATPGGNYNYIWPNALPSTNDLLTVSVSGSDVTLSSVSRATVASAGVNPTSGVLPYNNAGVFADSQLVRTSSSLLTVNTGQLAIPAGTTSAPSLLWGASSIGLFQGAANAVTYGGAGVGYAGFRTDSFALVSGHFMGWSNSTTNCNGVLDVGIARLAAGVIRISNAAAGAGQLVVGTSTASTSNQLTVDSQSSSRIAGFFSATGSPSVPTIKGEVSAIQSFAFHASGKLQGGCNAPTSNQQFSAIGNLKSDVSEVGNVGTGSDNLLSFGYSANSVANTGDTLWFVFTIVFASNANNKRVEVTFGGVSVFLISDTFGAAGQSQCEVTVKVRRTSSTTAKCTATLLGSDTLLRADCQYNEITTNFASGQTVQITGTATATNDIICKQLESDILIAQTS